MELEGTDGSEHYVPPTEDDYVRWIASHGAGDALAKTHRPDEQGNCQGCTTATLWPCRWNRLAQLAIRRTGRGPCC